MKYKNKDELQQEVQKRGRHIKMGRKALTQHSKPIRSCWFFVQKRDKDRRKDRRKTEMCIASIKK